MTSETDDKIDTILISCINRLYNKEANVGLDFDDLKCLEILYKIKKEAKLINPAPIPSDPTAPDNILELLRAVKGYTGSDNGN